MSGQRESGLLDKLLRAVAGALAGVGAAALAGIFVLVLVAVVMRYVWGRPFAFTEELSGLFMTLAVFTLLPSVVLREINIRVTVISERLPARAACSVCGRATAAAGFLRNLRARGLGHL